MNILEIFIGLNLTIAGIIRLTNKRIRNGEIAYLPFMNEPLAYLLAIFESLGVYFIALTRPYIRNMYLAIYCIATLVVTLYYLPSHKLSDIAELVTFKNEPGVIWYHALVCILMLTIIVRK